MNLDEKERLIANLELPWSGLAQSFRAARDQQIKNTQESMGNHEFTAELGLRAQVFYYEPLTCAILVRSGPQVRAVDNTSGVGPATR